MFTLNEYTTKWTNMLKLAASNHNEKPTFVGLSGLTFVPFK